VYTILILLHVLICISLIISVLLQSAKGEGLAGAFGGSSLTGTVFGGRGAATFLSKATTILAIAFMASSIVLTFVSPAIRASSSAVSGESAVQEAVQGGETPTQQPATTTPATTGGDNSAQPPSEPGSDLFDNSGEGGQQAQPGTQPASGQQPATGGEQPAQQQTTPPEGGGGK